MMKRFLAGAAVAGIAFASTAQAGTTNGAFNVSASLNSECAVAAGGPPTLDFGVYTAFGSAATPNPSITLTFNCTHTLPAPTVSGTPFDGTNGTTAGGGTVVGLFYTLGVTGPTSVLGTNATNSAGATADAFTYTITGTMGAGQPGQCATASCGPTTVGRTLTISF